ncbi:MAG: diguanylate cyclase domain-containing protein [Thermosynechococcaceae cyanobacterium]
MSNTTIKILLVEQNSAEYCLIRPLLQKSFGTQLELMTLEHLNGACTCLDSNRFDVCLLDLNLPDRAELDRLLILHKKNPRLPIVLLTHLEEEDFAIQALQLGAQDYLVKEHVNQTWLKRAIYSAIERVKLVEKIQASERQMQQLYLLLQARIKRRTHAIQKMHQQVQALKTISLIDSLTQITNRLGFDTRLEQEWIRNVANDTPLSLIMIDIDFFKQFNDTYGHLEGDHCLRQVAQCIQDGLHRPRDLVARYGGEEFGVILPETSERGASRLAERICENIRALEITHVTSPIGNRVTISLGIATTIPDVSERPQTLIRRADHALYQAKAGGRDRSALYQLDPLSDPNCVAELIARDSESTLPPP